MTLVSNTYWLGAPFFFKREPENARLRSLCFFSGDHRQLGGLYWTPENNNKPKVAAILMHPRVDFSRHYTIPRLLEAGFGCLTANTRNPNNDTTTVHEEIILDLAEVTKAECPGVAQQLLDFGVVGPGPRRALNFVFNRRWFDNEYDRSPAAETM